MFIEFDDHAGDDALAKRLSEAAEVSAGLFERVIAASPRLLTLKAMGKTCRMERLIACEAWTDAALELIALDIPAWHLKRVCLDEEEWICSLTRFPDLPDWLDDSAEARHSALPIAMLCALVGARGKLPAQPRQISSVSTAASADLADYR